MQIPLGMMTPSRLRRSGSPWACFIALALITTTAHAEDSETLADVGQDYYGQYCQVCHGEGGRGEGPFANVLDKPPPNLTEIATRRDGKFPALEVAEWIDGTRSVRAHGSVEMPIWGEQFAKEPSAADGQGSDNALQGRVYLLVEYLRSIQTGIEPEPPSRTLADAGRDVYWGKCSICHGVSGTGNGFLGVLLRDPPADLTTIAKRRDGSFPTLEIAEKIDGRREVKAHGDRTMPVWGRRFGERFAGGLGKETAIRGEIQLLVEYLRSIQQP